jgi:hypothetical protein
VHSSGSMLSREFIHGAMVWVIGVAPHALYGATTDDIFPPSMGWQIISGTEPAPTVHPQHKQQLLLLEQEHDLQSQQLHRQEDENAAAVPIQSAFRGRTARNSMAGHRAHQAKQKKAQLFVHAAGNNAVNGAYTQQAQERNGSPVYVHDCGSMLSRERIHGAMFWIIGLAPQALYGVDSEELSPPATGWKVISGAEPAPTLQDEDRSFCYLNIGDISTDTTDRQIEAAPPSLKSGADPNIDLQRQNLAAVPIQSAFRGRTARAAAAQNGVKGKAEAQENEEAVAAAAATGKDTQTAEVAADEDHAEITTVKPVRSLVSFVLFRLYSQCLTWFFLPDFFQGG